MDQIPLHTYFIFDGDLIPCKRFRKSENAGGVYEVLRVIKGFPLFLEDHLTRFFHSADIAGKPIRYTSGEIISFLHALILENGVTEGNILISCKEHLKAFFIAHHYPEPEWYEKGVPCGVLHAERKLPNAKVFQTPVRQQADEMIEKEGYYEVILVDHLGRITEGSRSNVFFVKDNQLFTPPGDEVLLGITRQKAITLAKEAGSSLTEEEIFLKDLPRFQAAFLTGTSPKILSLSQLGGHGMDPQNHMVQELRKRYDFLIDAYLRSVAF